MFQSDLRFAWDRTSARHVMQIKAGGQGATTPPAAPAGASKGLFDNVEGGAQSTPSAGTTPSGG